MWGVEHVCIAPSVIRQYVSGKCAFEHCFEKVQTFYWATTRVHHGIQRIRTPKVDHFDPHHKTKQTKKQNKL